MFRSAILKGYIRNATLIGSPLQLKPPLRPSRLPLITIPSSKSVLSTMAAATTFYDLKPLDKKGEPFDFKQLEGKVVLVVNVASKCGFTPQYEGLEALYKKYKDKGFVILGFPSNQFGRQEPGTNDEIQQFCLVNYGVSFPVLAKIDVNGDKADPVYKYLKGSKSGFLGLSRIKWNFEKFLLNKKGEVVERYASLTKPKDLEPEIEKLLAE